MPHSTPHCIPTYFKPLATHLSSTPLIANAQLRHRKPCPAVCHSSLLCCYLCRQDLSWLLTTLQLCLLQEPQAHPKVQFGASVQQVGAAYSAEAQRVSEAGVDGFLGAHFKSKAAQSTCSNNRTYGAGMLFVETIRTSLLDGDVIASSSEQNHEQHKSSASIVRTGHFTS